MHLAAKNQLLKLQAGGHERRMSLFHCHHPFYITRIPNLDLVSMWSLALSSV